MALKLFIGLACVKLRGVGGGGVISLHSQLRENKPGLVYLRVRGITRTCCA